MVHSYIFILFPTNGEDYLMTLQIAVKVEQLFHVVEIESFTTCSSYQSLKDCTHIVSLHLK